MNGEDWVQKKYFLIFNYRYKAAWEALNQSSRQAARNLTTLLVPIADATRIKVILFLLVLYFQALILSVGNAEEKISSNITPKIIPKIIIDPGHGGKDPGASSSKYKLVEKDLVLKFSKKISASLKKKMGAQVLLTRTGDQFIELDARNRFANKSQCDLFVSVHANAAANNEAQGVEIYYLNRASDRSSEKLARRENGRMAIKSEKEIHAILSDLIQAAATEESALLAKNIKNSLKNNLEGSFGVENIKVKTALFYVLVGAKCPSLLIEIGFITHPREAKILKSEKYQNLFAESLADAIKKYWENYEKEGGDL